MFKLSIILFLLSYGSIAINAQEHNLNNYSAIILDVVEQDNRTKIHDLTITLCDADGTDHIFDVPENSKPVNSKLSMPYTFTDYKVDHRKKRTRENSYFKPSYFSAFTNHYVCMVPTFTMQNDLLIQNRNISVQKGSEPLLDVKKIFLYIKIKGRGIKTQIIKIPSTHLYSMADLGSGTIYKPYSVEPITIVMQKEEAMLGSTKQFGVIQMMISELEEKIGDIDGGVNVGFKSIQLIDEISGTVLQSIPQIGAVYKNKIVSAGYLKSLSMRFADDAYKPILVPATLRVKPTVNQPIIGDAYIIYTFDKSTKRYRIDSLLSWPDFIKEINFHQTVIGTNVAQFGKNLIYKNYKLQGDAWQWMRSDTNVEKNIVEQAAPPPQEPKPHCYVEQANKLRPLLFFDTSVHQIIMRDTFYLINYGSVDAHLKLNYPTTYFDFPKKIKAKQRVPIYYERKINNALIYTNEPYTNYEDALHLEFDSGQVATALTKYDIVNNRSQKVIHPDNTIIYTLHLNELEVFETTVNAAAIITASGKKSRADNSKTGQWRVWNETKGTYELQQFQKILFVYLLGEGDLNKCTIKVIDTSGEAKIITSTSNTNARVYVSASSQKIVISNDSASAEYIIQFDMLQQQETVAMQLLHPDELYYYRGTQKFPINLNPNLYHIQWAEEPFNLKKDFMYLQQLQQNFPKLIWHKPNELAQMDIDLIDFANCTDKEKQEVLHYFENNKHVKYVAQLWQTPRPTYCDNRVYLHAGSMHYKIPETQIEKAKLAGFTYLHTETNPSQVSIYFKYSKKVIDENFFKQFNELVHAFSYQQIFLNVYSKVQLDDRLDNKVHGKYGW
jgi:hypothetical protein